MESYFEMEKDNFTVRIFADTDPVNPRTEYDHVGEIIALRTTGRNAVPGDSVDGYNEVMRQVLRGNFDAEQARQFLIETGELDEDDADDDAAMLDLLGGEAVTIPLQYDGRFSETDDYDRLDAVVVVEPDVAAKEWAGDKEDARKYLLAELETYNAYLDGDVYGYEVTDCDGNVVDSLYGLYGLSYAREEAEAALEFYVKRADAARNSVAHRAGVHNAG